MGFLPHRYGDDSMAEGLENGDRLLALRSHVT
jgi:hypothetical protein